ncbi:MAG TPA: ABC transporter ATP-binding protein [Nitrospiraceae bacterium]|nr:ABC transporter ATP-binding protein [Nitrospiraceae bacterium]
MQESSRRFSIEVTRLVKRYGPVLAVDDLTLQVRSGEFFSLLGPSGAGKTSVLRVLAGFETPDSGSLMIEGRSMAGVPPHRRPVNLVFQSYALFPHLRVGDNVAFGPQMQRLPRMEIQKRVRNMLALVKLPGKEDRWPHELSGGEQQRVALARGLINRPAVLLLDEPLSALDQRLRQEMQVELKSIQERVGITFVCVTHHQQEALAMSDRVGVMLEGRLIQVGRPRDIYERPTALSVARFIGDSNELTGELCRTDDGYGVMTPTVSGLSTMRVRCSPDRVVAGKVVLLLRPEQIELSSEAHPAGRDNRLPGTIEKCLYVGQSIQYVVRVAEDVVWKVVVPVRPGEAKTFVPGERVSLIWRADDGMIFPQ